MSKEKFLFILGILVIALPHLGFPNGLEKIIFAVFGITTVLISYAFFFRSKNIAPERAIKKTRQPSVRKPRTTIAPAITPEEEEKTESVQETATQQSEENTGFTFVKRNDRS